MKKPAAKLLETVRRGVQTVAYRNPIYKKILASGAVPDRLFFTLPDPWPGDAQAGLALMSAQGALFDQPSPPRHATALRNLRAVGTTAAQMRVVRLIESWGAQHDQWDDVEWAPDVLGERLAAWIGFYEFYAPAAPEGFLPRLLASLQKQHKHLARTLSPQPSGLAGLRAIKGLILSALNFDDSDAALGLAVEALQRLLSVEILPDGGVISRSPATQLHTLRYLIDLRAILTAAEIEAPEILRTSITLMLPALKLMRHGDGGLALFHGSTEETPLLIESVITNAEARSRMLRRLPDTNYERITAGRSLLLADCGRPPPRGHDKNGHAGLAAFEFDHGRERIIVNCGAVEGGSLEWRTACAATAAHSTLTVEDTNACEVIETSGIVCAAHVTTQRFEQDGTHGLEITHDGYRPMFGLTYQRTLTLNAEGDLLQGREVLSGTGGRAFAIRWHLHPAVQAALAHSGQAALLRTDAGHGWRLRIEGAALQLESGLYCGSGTARRSLQIKAIGHTNAGETTVSWSLSRERKG